MPVRYAPSPHIRAALWLVLNVISAGAARLRERLGIGPGGFKPFLRRDEIGALRRFLRQAEPMIRRVLFLAALELGALPARSVPSNKEASARRIRPPAGPGPARASRFRITESTRTGGHAPPPPLRLTGPSIRRLDLPYTPDLREYPQHPDDILPARAMVRRLLALEDALDHPGRYITAMRRRLSGAARILAALPPRLYRRGPLTCGQQQAARLIAEEAAHVQARLDTS